MSISFMRGVIILNSLINSVDAIESNKEYQLFYIGSNPSQYDEEIKVKSIDFDEYIFAPPVDNGARHPVATREQMQALIDDLQIADGPIILFDDGEYFRAGRTLWTFKYFGLKEVYVLRDMRNIKELISNVKSFTPNTLAVIDIDESVFADMQFTKSVIDDNAYVIVDFRPTINFAGTLKDFDPEAGHIPHSLSIPAERLILNGEIVRDELLERVFSRDFDTHKKVVATCGSGIKASLGYLALDELGIDTRLYIGSMSDWISGDNPVEYSDIL